MTRTLPISKAREELTTLVDRAQNMLDEFVITVKGYPAAMIVPLSVYESWKETQEILSDKKLMKEIKLAEKELNEGKGIDWEDVKKDLKINV